MSSAAIYRLTALPFGYLNTVSSYFYCNSFLFSASTISLSMHYCSFPRSSVVFKTTTFRPRVNRLPFWWKQLPLHISDLFIHYLGVIKCSYKIVVNRLSGVGRFLPVVHDLELCDHFCVQWYIFRVWKLVVFFYKTWYFNLSVRGAVELLQMIILLN